MTLTRLRFGLLIVLVVAADAALVLLAYVLGPSLSAHEKLFPVAAAGVAGILCLIVGGFLLEPAWLLSIGIGMTIFSGDWSYLHIPGPVDRVVTVAGILAVLIRSRVDPETPRIEGRRVHWLFVFLLLYAIGSAAWSNTLGQHAALYELLDRLGVFPFLLYLIAPAAFSTPHQRRILLIVLAVVGAYLGLISVFETIGPKSLVYPRYIVNPTIAAHYPGRALGPFLEPGANGLAMFNGAVACALLLVDARLSRRVRGLLLAVIALSVLGIVLTLTRQVWVGAAAGALIAGLLYKPLRRYVPVGLLVAAVITGGLITLVPSVRHHLTARATTQQSLWDRYNSDDAALRMIESRPLLGFGWGQFPNVSPRYYHVARNYPLTSVKEVHNVVLSNFAELGFVGVVGWLVTLAIAMLGPLLRRGPPVLEPWKFAALAVAVAWFVQANFAPVSYAYDNYIPWIFAGIAYGLRRTGVEAQTVMEETVVAPTSSEAVPVAPLA